MLLQHDNALFRVSLHVTRECEWEGVSRQTLLIVKVVKVRERYDRRSRSLFSAGTYDICIIHLRYPSFFFYLNCYNDLNIRIYAVDFAT